MATLNSKKVGDIVKIKENGVDVDFIIVHKGNPDPAMYDASCDGVWVLRKEVTGDNVAWGQSLNYGTSTVDSHLNSTYLQRFDSQTRYTIKSVKIPYRGASWPISTGGSGLLRQIFLLSGYEIGLTHDINNLVPANDGACLDYFEVSPILESRIAFMPGSSDGAWWWLRCPMAGSSESSGNAIFVKNDGSAWRAEAKSAMCSVRPAFVLPSYLTVNSDGTVLMNSPPVIASDKTGNLGTLESGFTCNYSVNDGDASDTLTAALTLDGVQLDKFSAERGRQYAYSLAGNEWLKITNGSHTFKISVSDGKETVENTATFSRNADGAFISLEAPMEADDIIRVCSLKVEGSFPADAVCKYEVTNNALDNEPVWEDCTAKVKAGLAYLFQNKAAENGSAFNFRILAKRGVSNTGGYITGISGGFE